MSLSIIYLKKIETYCICYSEFKYCLTEEDRNILSFFCVNLNFIYLKNIETISICCCEFGYYLTEHDRNILHLLL